MPAELTRDDLADALDTVSEETLRETGVDRPPVDAFAVAARLGIAVAKDDGQSGRARYVRLRDWGRALPKPAIFLRNDPRPERRQWAVAHEIGEHRAHLVFARLGVDPHETAVARESVANWLAARLLLPRSWFFDDALQCEWDLAQLKRRYVTASHELIARRMLDAQLPVVISVFDHGRLTFRRGNLPGACPPLCHLERDCRRAAHCSGEPSVAMQPGITVQAWPVHEPDWHREIMRMEVDEYCNGFST
jgi:Zn-dependent peptidase ImmA (M78 family)